MQICKDAYMKVLLTGAAGFLGSHLSMKLIEQKHEVVALDDLSTGSLKNLEQLMSHPKYTFIEHDVRIPYQAKFDAILNFACPASPVNYQKDPVRTIETNFLGMINLLHLANETGARIIQASTSEIYGDPTQSPQKESYWGNVNPIGIRSCYDEGKRAAETLCFDYRRQYNLDTRVIRIFNTYGPNMAVGDGRVVSNFIVHALRNKPINIYGDGKQTRSFCYVSDLVEGIYKLLQLDKNPETPINLGNPNEFTVLELAKIVIEITNSKSEIVNNSLPLDDPKQRCPDISLAKSILNWKPSIELREGIEKTAAYFKQII
jgi:UDP-glucuronate decarboxylase